MKLFSDSHLINEREFILKKIPLGKRELISIIYHDIFDYPLTIFELIKWSAGNKVKLSKTQEVKIVGKRGYLSIKDREGLILKRFMRKRISARKMVMAKKVAKILSFIPTIKMVAVTGALAMENANEEADIDLMIITSKGTLWTTRLFTLLLLDILRIPRRKYGDRNQKDKLCLNIWLDENNLAWRKRNIFTAHEIAQIKPLVNKEEAYEKFISKNKWIADYWPNAVKIQNYSRQTNLRPSLFTIFEPLTRKFQLWYMKDKVTREVVTPTRALFHPIDWGDIVASKLKLFLN